MSAYEIQVADTEGIDGAEDFEGIKSPVNPVGFGNITEEEYDTERDKGSSKTFYIVIIIEVLLFYYILTFLHQNTPCKIWLNVVE